MADEDILTEELDAGIIDTSGGIRSTSGDFSLGTINVGTEPVVTTPDLTTPSLVVEETVETTPGVAAKPSGYTAPASDSEVTLAQVAQVRAQFINGCQSFTSIVDATQLPREIVAACIQYLKKYEGLVTGNNFYCTMDNLAALQSQLTLCQKCCSSK
jgi:hypothetical protein